MARIRSGSKPRPLLNILGFTFMTLGFISKKNVVFLMSVAAWVIVVGFGLRTLLLYAYTPGRLASPSSSWPVDSPIPLARGRMSLLVFTHPQCPVFSRHARRIGSASRLLS